MRLRLIISFICAANKKRVHFLNVRLFSLSRSFYSAVFILDPNSSIKIERIGEALLGGNLNSSSVDIARAITFLTSSGCTFALRATGIYVDCEQNSYVLEGVRFTQDKLNFKFNAGVAQLPPDVRILLGKMFVISGNHDLYIDRANIRLALRGQGQIDSLVMFNHAISYLVANNCTYRHLSGNSFGLTKSSVHVYSGVQFSCSDLNVKKIR